MIQHGNNHMNWCIIIIQMFKRKFFLFFYYHYCKRCYFRVTKFSRLAAQKHIRGLLNSSWADISLVILVLLNIFVGFWIRACWICAKYAKINVPRIFPLLQYMYIAKWQKYIITIIIIINYEDNDINNLTITFNSNNNILKIKNNNNTNNNNNN